MFGKESGEEQLTREQEKLRANYPSAFQRFTSIEAIEADKETFNYLPKNARNLLFFDILLGKIEREELLGENMSLGALRGKVHEIFQQNLLSYEEFVQMLQDSSHLRSFLGVIWDNI